MPLYESAPRSLFAAVAVAAAALTPGAAWPAEPAASAWVETEQSAVRLIAASETAGNGEAIVFGLQFRLKPGWKIYWRSPGDAGFPPIPDWSGSTNLKSAALSWPTPTRFSVIGLETLGYKEEVVLPLKAVPERAADGVGLKANIRYLTCDEVCIPYEADLALALPAGPPKPSRFAHLISRFAVTVPGDGRAHGLSLVSAAAARLGGKPAVRVAVRSTEPFKAPDLFIEGPPELSFAKPVVRLFDGRRSAVMDVVVYGVDQLEDELGPNLGGRDLVFTLSDGKRAAEKRLPVAAGGAVGPAPGLLAILGLALIGGLILNLMPCVLPVLSLKVLGVISHGGGETRYVRMSFVATAAGIVFSFLVLAAALIGLKQAGAAVGWGIQFQHPWFLTAMALLVTFFACNLWGLFRIRLPAWFSVAGGEAAHGLGAHFLHGALATLLATPCSAPFLGTAVGFALARGGAEIVAVFAVLGLGLALPYLLVAAAPRLATRLPKPGPWMIRLRQLLGIALAATGAWLISVLSAIAGFTAAVAIGVILLLVVIVFIVLRRSRAEVRGVAGFSLSALILLAFLTPGWVAGSPGNAAAEAEAKVLKGLWTAFDEVAIAGLVAAGKTVFVDVTADWCITCQVNKSLVLGRGEVLTRLSADGVVAMQADWTRPDEEISMYLAGFQRYGIPFNAVYGPQAPNGIVLPELLSEDAVLDALATAAGGTAVSARP